MSVLRLMPKVRQTAALVAPPSSAAVTAASFSASMAAGRPPRRPRRRAAASPALDPLLDQRPLELGQRAENVEQELTLRRGGVHLLGQRTEGDAARLEIGHRGEEVRLPDNSAPLLETRRASRSGNPPLFASI